METSKIVNFIWFYGPGATLIASSKGSSTVISALPHLYGVYIYCIYIEFSMMLEM